MPFQYKVSEDKKVRVIIDTDAACEADDPFAIAHALMCQKFDVRAIFAEQFNREGSTRQSYEEILTVLRAMKKEVPVFMGEETKISEKKQGEEVSPAADFLIEEAMRVDEKPLFVLCIDYQCGECDDEKEGNCKTHDDCVDWWTGACVQHA